jgi:hypothetical protein
MSTVTLWSISASNDLNSVLFTLEIPEVQSNEESEENNPTSTMIDNETKNVEEFALKAMLEKQDSFIYNFIMYNVEGFGLNLSPNSTLCPTNNCEFEQEILAPSTFLERNMFVEDSYHI